MSSRRNQRVNQQKRNPVSIAVLSMYNLFGALFNKVNLVTHRFAAVAVITIQSDDGGRVEESLQKRKSVVNGDFRQSVSLPRRL